METRIKKIKDFPIYDYRYVYLYQIKIFGFWITYKTVNGELI